MRYRAFFSYARADDRVANWLHRQLDGYRTPKPLVGSEGALGPVPPKLHPIFRDRTDLESGGPIDVALQQALEDSDTLIVLCTPTSAKSHWVNHEVETFRKLGREAAIFPVIAAGVPDSGDPETECFPPALRSKGLLAADLREIKLPTGQLVGDGREGGRLKLIAGLLGVNLDALVRRERRRQRQLLAMTGLVACLFAVLSLVAVYLGLSADRAASIATRRAAILSIEAADREAESGRVDASLLILLEAAKVFDEESVPDALLISFDRTLLRANSQSRFGLTRGSRPFHVKSGVAIVTPTGDLSVICNSEGPIQWANIGGPAALVTDDFDGNGLFAVRDDGVVFSVVSDAAPRKIGQFKKWTREPDPAPDPGPDTEGFETSSLFRWPEDKTLRYWVGRGVVEAFNTDLGKSHVIADFDFGIGACGMGALEKKVAPALPQVERESVGSPQLVECRTEHDGWMLTYESLSAANVFRDTWLVRRPELAGGKSIVHVSGNSLSLQPIKPTYVGSYEDALAFAQEQTLSYKPPWGRDVEWVTQERIAFASYLSDGTLAAVDILGDLFVFKPRKAFSYSRRPISLDWSDVALSTGRCIENGDWATANGVSLWRSADGAVLQAATDGRKLIEIPVDDGVCPLVSHSGRYLLNGRLVFDLGDLWKQPDVRAVATMPAAVLGFAADSEDILSVDGTKVYLSRASQRFASETIFTSEFLVSDASMSPDGRYLLVTEELGFEGQRGLVYSTDAKKVWRDLGTRTKWFTARFFGPRDVVFSWSSEMGAEVLHLHTLNEAVANARNALSKPCQNFHAEEYSRSACWPQALRFDSD